MLGHDKESFSLFKQLLMNDNSGFESKVMGSAKPI